MPVLIFEKSQTGTVTKDSRTFGRPFALVEKSNCVMYRWLLGGVEIIVDMEVEVKIVF